MRTSQLTLPLGDTTPEQRQAFVDTRKELKRASARDATATLRVANQFTVEVTDVQLHALSACWNVPVTARAMLRRRVQQVLGVRGRVGLQEDVRAGLTLLAQQQESER